MPPTTTNSISVSSEQQPEQVYSVRQSVQTYEHRDSQATAMTVDYNGHWVLLAEPNLAGRSCLSLQRLGQEAESGTLIKYYQNSKYEITAAEFSICPEKKDHCAIAMSDSVNIVVYTESELKALTSLRGHTRTVTDIDWHRLESNFLASCSIDTFSHIWDLRDTRKPFMSLSAVCMSGATQVGFNRVSGNLLCAAHDGDLRVWDIRKGSCPLYITAHLNRVHGINWSHRRETFLATASQDGTVKYFDVNNPRRAEKIITTLSPVWRARYTPIGNGLVSIVVPHLGRGENSLLLWSNSNSKKDPICSFVGHTDVILDFAWRPNRENESEIELVTWSRDRTLRVWKIDEQMLKLCEPDIDETYDTSDSYTISDTPTRLRVVHSPVSPASPNQQTSTSLPTEAIDALQISASPRSPTPMAYLRHNREESQPTARSLTDKATISLHHEFSLLNTNMPHIEVETLSPFKRFAIFKISAGGHVLVLDVRFPTEYPSPNAPPEFNFCQGTTLNDHLSNLFLKVLKTNALQRVRKSRTCLEQCLRAVASAMRKSGGGPDKSDIRLQSPRLEGALSGALHDACIPFPRTSSVSFNAVGMLATFAQTLNTKRLTVRHENITPRTLSAINGSGLLGNVMGPQPVLYAHRDSNATFYLHDRMTSKHPKSRSISKPTTSNAMVHVYEARRLLHLSRELAENYSLDKRNIAETCRHNRDLCEKYGRFDLVPIWKLAELIATPNLPNETKFDSLFYKDPFKESLLRALIMHFATAGDLQTAVTLSCLFHKCQSSSALSDSATNSLVRSNGGAKAIGSSSNENQKAAQRTPDTSPYHTVLPLDYQASHAKSASLGGSTASASNYTPSSKQLMRKNSLGCEPSGRLNDEPQLLCSPDFSYSCSLVQPAILPMLDHCKKVYSEILFGWQLLTKRALILKHTIYSEPPSKSVEIVTLCSKCNELRNTLACKKCLRPVLYCSLCNLPVKGSSSACFACGHGGHMRHMQQWFEKNDVCASGCGCRCLKHTAMLFERNN